MGGIRRMRGRFRGAGRRRPPGVPAVLCGESRPLGRCWSEASAWTVEQLGDGAATSIKPRCPRPARVAFCRARHEHRRARRSCVSLLDRAILLAAVPRRHKHAGRRHAAQDELLAVIRVRSEVGRNRTSLAGVRPMRGSFHQIRNSPKFGRLGPSAGILKLPLLQSGRAELAPQARPSL